MMEKITELKTCRGKKPFPFMKYKWPFLVTSIFFVGMSLYFITVKGLNYSVEFKGGTKIVMDFQEGIGVKEIREATDTALVGDVQVVQFGGDSKQNQYMLRAKYVEGKDEAALLIAALTTKFGAENVTVLSQEVVGPTVGKDLRQKGFWSIIICCALILVYVGFRFDSLFAPGGVIALIHDVVVSAGFFALFQKEFSLSILAALLTILGYSINDTIVIYDRIRENITRLPKNTPTETIIDISVTETMSRTIVTSLTVIFVLVVIFFFGGSVLHDFAFCLIIGCVFGSYSTIFIASPVYLWLQKAFPHRGLKGVGDVQTS